MKPKALAFFVLALCPAIAVAQRGETYTQPEAMQEAWPLTAAGKLGLPFHRRLNTSPGSARVAQVAGIQAAGNAANTNRAAEAR